MWSHTEPLGFPLCVTVGFGGSAMLFPIKMGLFEPIVCWWWLIKGGASTGFSRETQRSVNGSVKRNIMVTGSEVSWSAKAWKTFVVGRYFSHFLREIDMNNRLLKKKNISAMLQKSAAIHVKALHPKVSTLIRNIHNKQVELWFVILWDEGSASLQCTKSKQPKRLLF